MKKIINNFPLFYSKFIWKRKTENAKPSSEKLPSARVEDMNFLLGDEIGNVSEWFSSRATEVLQEGGHLDKMVQQAVVEHTKELSGRITVLDERVSVQEKQIKALEEKDEKQQAQIDAQGQQIKDQEAILKSQKELIDKLTKGLGKLKGEHDELDGKHSTLDGKVTGLRTEHDALKSGHESLSTRTGKIEADQKALQLAFKEVKGLVEALEGRVDLLGDQEEAVKELKDRMQAVEDEIKGINGIDEARIIEIKEEIKGFKEEIKKLTEGNTNLNNKLDGVFDATKRRIGELNEAVKEGLEAADTERAELRESDYGLNDKILKQGERLALIKDVIDQLGEVENLAQRISDNSSRIGILEKKEDETDAFKLAFIKLQEMLKDLSPEDIAAIPGLQARVTQADKERAELRESDYALNEKILDQGERLALVESVMDQLENLEGLVARISNLEDKAKDTDLFKMEFAEFRAYMKNVDMNILAEVPGLTERMKKVETEALHLGIEMDKANEAIAQGEAERKELIFQMKNVQDQLDNLDFSKGIDAIKDVLAVLTGRVNDIEEEQRFLLENTLTNNDRMDEMDIGMKELRETDYAINQKIVGINKRIEKLEAVDNNLKAIEELTKQMRTIEGQVATHENQIGSNRKLGEKNRGLINELEAAWTRLDDQLKGVKLEDITKIPGMKIRLDKADKERAELSKRQDELSAWVRRIEIRITELDFSKDISEIRDELEGFRPEIERLALENTNLGNKLEGALQAFKRRFEEQEKRIVELEKLNGLVEQVQEILLRIEVQGEQIDKNSVLIKELNGAWKELQETLENADLDFIKEAIPELFKDIDAAKRERNTLFEGIAEIEQEQAKMNVRIDDLRESVGDIDIKGLIMALQERVEKFQVLIDTLLKQNVEQGKFNADVTSAINSLNEKVKELGEMEERIVMLETDLKDSVRELEEAIARGEKNVQDLEERVNDQLTELDEGLSFVKKQLKMMAEAFRGLKQDNEQINIVITSFKQIIHQVEIRINKLTEVRNTKPQNRHDTSKPTVSNPQGSAEREGFGGESTTGGKNSKRYYGGPGRPDKKPSSVAKVKVETKKPKAGPIKREKGKE